MRKISEEVENKVFELWLEGHTYRKISPKCGGCSLATISKIVDSARGRVPDLDDLRQLNVTLRKGDSSVYDGIRGGKVLDELNNFGVSLDHLERYVKLAEKISSEKDVGTDKFVGSAMRLTSLEQQTGKTYGEVIKDFEQNLVKITELEGSLQKIQKEIERVKQEKAEIKKVFEDQGLGWDDGIQILRQVKDVRAELNSLQVKIAKETANWQKAIESYHSANQQLITQHATLRGYIKTDKTRLDNLRKTYNKEYGWLNIVLGNIASAEDDLDALRRQRQREKQMSETDWEELLRSTISGVNDEKFGRAWKTVKGAGLLAMKYDVPNILSCYLEYLRKDLPLTKKPRKEDVEELRKKIDGLKAEKEKIQSERDAEIKKTKNLAQKIVADAEQKGKMILAGAEEKREKILGEVDDLNKKIDILEAEHELVEAKLKDDVQKLRKKPREISMRLSPEQFKTLEKIASNGDVEDLIRDQIRFICKYAS